MDFFDDPNLFVGGLEGLDEDGFPSGPSLVDELNLSAEFEPLQVEPLGPGKHQGIMPPASSTSSQQTMPAYSQQMDHYSALKAQDPMGQTFPSPGGPGGGGGGMMAQQHGQYHSASMSQVPQTNGLFCNSSSPMWGNQDQNGNIYHPLSQQQQQQRHQQQQLHNQQLHLRQQQTQQQQHHPCHQQQQQRMQQQQLQQQQSHHQQLLNQHQHQQMNHQTLPLQQQQHHNFSFHQGSHSQSQEQVHHTQQQVQHQLTIAGPRFHSRALPSKSYLENQNASMGGTCLQQQQQQSGYQLTRGGQAFPGSRPEDPSMSFPMPLSSMVHSLSSCSVSSATAYQPSQYPAYPGEQDIPSLSQQSLSSASVSRPTTTAPLTSAVPDISGAACQFPSTVMMDQQQPQTPVGQGEECPFRALSCSGQTQGNFSSSEMFGQAMSCYPSMNSQLPSEQPQSCGASGVSATNTNGYQALGESLLPSEAEGGDLEGLEAPDLLPDLLPQLEAAFSQQDESNCSWASGGQEKGEGERKSAPVEYKEEKVIPLHTLK